MTGRNLTPDNYEPVVSNVSRFRDGVQFRSGLVDLVVNVRRDGGDGHRLSLAGERFEGLVTEDLA